MKFTLSWLKDHLETDKSVEELTTALSAIGLEVEGIEDPAKLLGPFKIARIVEAKKHPNASKLQVVRVEIAKGQPLIEVVCGALNAHAGVISVFAPLGTYMPGSKITLEKKSIRGIVSSGMMCSAAELELSDESDSILDLPAEWAEKVGERYIDLAGLNDPVIKVKLTPNRPDCTGIRGIARDLAAAGMGTLKPEPKLGTVEGKSECPIDIKLNFPKDTANACPIFAGRLVKGVKNGPSLAWVKNRLKAVGFRPINALVDVTNYISLDRGRPLRIYDADKLKGAICVRLGKVGEKFLALDGKEYSVDDTMCVIADDSGLLGLGGIVGGEASSLSEATMNIFIESAYFDPVRTAATGRKVGLQTDARYRFERGVDPASERPGLDLTTDMILKFCGGEPTKAKVAGKEPIEERVIPFNYARVDKLSGMKLTDMEISNTLKALGFMITGEPDAAKIMVPTWRPDVHGTADLVEEVVRIAGLDRIPTTPWPRADGIARAILTDKQKRVRRARRLLAARGFVEAVTWSFIPKAEATHFGGDASELDLSNPISVEMSSMRPCLLPGLLSAVTRNRNRGMADVALFELGQAYRGEKPEDQYMSAAGVRAGTSHLTGSGRHWSGNATPVSVFDVKADAFAALSALGIDPTKAQIMREAPHWYHPGRSGALKLGPETVLAYFGEIHPATLKALDVEAPISAFEIFLDVLPSEKKKSRAKPPLAISDLMPVTRDLSFIVPKDVSADDVVKAATNSDKALIKGVNVFDVFDGGSLSAEGKKSIAVEVTIQPATETLTDKAIETITQKIITDVKLSTSGDLRS